MQLHDENDAPDFIPDDLNPETKSHLERTLAALADFLQRKSEHRQRDRQEQKASRAKQRRAAGSRRRGHG